MRSLAALLLVPAALADDPGSRLNPNQEYRISNAMDGRASRGFSGEFFEVMSSAIKSRYSEVIWKVLPTVALPPNIVQRYNNKVMAVTGFEVNVVRNVSGTEVSVPCYESYNHHYVSYIHGKGSNVEISTVPQPMTTSHNDGVHFTPNDDAMGAAFTAQAFSEHNGNEARQTYHGMPVGQGGRQFVVGIESPQHWTFGPMQINTRNPDGTGRRCGKDGVVCPLPKSSNAPHDVPWNGILECPCTTRVKKEFGGHFTQVTGDCGHAEVGEAAECFEAVETLLGPSTQNKTISDPAKPAGCFVVSSNTSRAVFFNTANTSTAACGGSGSLSGFQNSTVAVKLEISDVVRITMSVPDLEKHWYGVGFNASAMDGTYAIVVDGAGKISEHSLGNHQQGKQLPPSAGLKIVSQGVEGGRRVTVLERPLKGASPDYFTFSTAEGQLQFISAVGSTPAFAQHRARSTATLSLVSTGGDTCVCRGGIGKINGMPFNPQCPGEPKSDLLKTHNPTCDLNSYAGGMSCCRGDVFLLDADQEIPELEDEVFYKWRFYFDDWKPATQRQTYHLEWQFGHIEYDVPRAPPGTPPADTIHTLTTRFTAWDFLETGNRNAGGEGWDLSNGTAGTRDYELVMAGFHCHSPACLGGELFNADTNELLCKIEPIAGGSDTAQDEEDYLWLPPCQWGDRKEGLAPPPRLSPSTNLLSIKYANSTYGHYGVMAIWQGRGAWAE